MTLLQELINYSNDVIAGKVVACKKHRWACMRFLGDLDKQNTPDFPYVFIEAKAERFLNWARLFKHTKGELAGQYIVPDIIHKFIFGNVYGWINVNTGYRRFNKIYWQVGRKNTKSQWLSIVGSYETMAFDETGMSLNEVYCAATKSDQAKIVYNETVNMLKKAEIFRGKYKESYGRLYHIKSGSFMRPLSEEDRRTGDGYNPQCGIIDEYHAHETAEMYDILVSGMGSRPEPLLAIITTAGFDLNSPCFRIEYDLVSKILNPDIDVTLDNYFVMINELDFNDTPDPIQVNGKTIKPGELIDDITDEKVWAKANPIICSYEVGINFLRKALREALEAPEKMRNFLTKHMNHWINMRELGYMDMAKWNACKGEIPDLRGQKCYIGGDLSSKLDLSSITFEFSIEEQYIILSHSFIPEDTALQKEKTDKVQYRRWADEGWLTLLPGAAVNEDDIIEWLCDKLGKEGWIPVEDCLDPWGTVTMAAKLIDRGHTVINIIQGPKTLSEPTKDFRCKVYERKIIHDGNPILSWAMSNAIVDVVDRNENIMLNKQKSRQRIDPIAATINAHVRAMLNVPESNDATVLFF